MGNFVYNKEGVVMSQYEMDERYKLFDYYLSEIGFKDVEGYKIKNAELYMEAFERYETSQGWDKEEMKR